ncbi:hypothetical protein SVIOM342S_06716 [Streptomyces violaceorubidus]
MACTRTSATQGAIKAIGSSSHTPATAQASSAAPAAFSDCTTRVAFAPRPLPGGSGGPSDGTRLPPHRGQGPPAPECLPEGVCHSAHAVPGAGVTGGLVSTGGVRGVRYEGP